MDTDKILKSIYEQQEELTELYNKKIINTDTYYNLLDETCNELYAEEEEDFKDEEYEYIYRVDFIGMGKNQSLYFKEATDTHFYLNMECTIGQVKVRYLRILKSSPEYQSAFYNSKTNNRFQLAKSKSKGYDNINDIFFTAKDSAEI